ncbi:uncharacterized protein HMPREF1541_04047 [Cyphellophora europaea CBS 101466]|uniref:Uncharacterized protein n=1 Tax=Cyphellophora europaea (strain CBS 101466) TaxID=1220924 RepID=W2S232_CYPE1|nr:uncharacterized protein HMPREF1541_04047 [Cyphellophora europaea CBS 101466]ETN42108.1 hypothetical protein HMPREF1541_04047 [Cyphellophora europaea CBS 101466]
MDKRSSKKRKVATSSDPKITDSRFASIQTDPRYRLPSKAHKVKLDARFSRALKDDDDFTRHAKVDRYGRPLEADSERKRLKRKYEFEDDGGSESDEPDDDEVVRLEMERVGGPKTVKGKRDLLREGRPEEEEDSSSDESSSSEEEDEVEEAELSPQTGNEVPTGEVSSRLAVVNLDWDNIRAEDLMAVFSSFVESSGKLLKVAIYPSEFGKERMQREEMEGPPKEIFAIGPKPEHGKDEFEDFGSESESEDDDEALKEKLIKPDDGATDFDSQALRSYQLDRLRYFYAILTFSSPVAAKHIYDAVDGTEYLSTANFFDLRFVPDETDFSTDEPREVCESISSSYKPNEFVTDALQHSKVKLTWDAEDTNRKEAAAAAFRSKDIRDIEGVDLAAYIGSDSDSDVEPENEVNASNAGDGLSKKETERQKLRSLLGLASDPAPSKSKKDRAPVGNVEITFSAGLTSGDADKKRGVFENSLEELEETTIEKYVRKEKERKARRREKAKAIREGRPVPDELEDGEPTGAAEEEAAEEDDAGFNDPFFADPSDPSTAQAAMSEKKKLRKEERLKKRLEREAEEAAEQKSRAELELLMADDRNKDGEGLRHFDMRDVEKAEKAARKKHLKKGKNKKDKDRSATVEGDQFQMDTADPRFAGRLFGNHEFAIDPTNPRFKGTKGMQNLLEEGRRRKKTSQGGERETEGDGKSKSKSKSKKEAAGLNGQGDRDDVKRLVEKIKKRKA